MGKTFDFVRVLKGPSGLYYYRLENGDNQQIMATSQVYRGDNSKGNARRAASALCQRHPGLILRVED